MESLKKISLAVTLIMTSQISLKSMDANAFNVSVGAQQRSDGREYIWCQRNNGQRSGSVFRHRVGDAAGGSGTPIVSCADYGNGLTEVSPAVMDCLNGHNIYEYEADAFASSGCSENPEHVATTDQEGPSHLEENAIVDADGRTAEELRQEEQENIPDPTVAGTGTGNGVAASVTTTDQDRVDTAAAQQSIAGKSLDEISCDLKVLAQPRTTTATSKFELKWETPDLVQSPTMASAPASRHASAGGQGQRSNFDGEAFDDENYDDNAFEADFDGSGSSAGTAQLGHPVFFEAPLLTYCESQGSSPWPKFHSQLGKSSDTTLWDPSWSRIYRKVLGLDSNSNYLTKGIEAYTEPERKFITACKDNPQNIRAVIDYAGDNTEVQKLQEKLKKSYANGVKKLALHRRNLEKCEALAHITSGADYDRDYEASSSSSAKTIKKSFDGKVSCQTYGPEAQDFKDCAAFVDAYDASMVAKAALQTGQGIHYQGQTMDRQADLQRQQAIGGLDHRGALGSQKDDIKDRADYATQNAVLDSAKLGVLFGILTSIPDRKDLAKKCNQSIRTNAPTRLNASHTKVLDAFSKAFGYATAEEGKTAFYSVGANADGKLWNFPSDAAEGSFLSANGSQGDLCSITAYHKSAHTLVMNIEMRSQAKQILAQTAIDAAAMYTAAGMLNSQAKKIDDLIKKIDGYDPSEDFVAPTTDLIAGPCAFDPTQPGCGGNSGATAQQVGFGSNSLSFGGGGFGSSGTMINADEGYDNAAGDREVTADRGDASMPVGSVIAGVDKKSGFVDPAASAASIKSSAAGRNGGGGGGSASAVGSTGGGGGGQGQGGQARGGQAGGGKQIAYAASSIGRLSGGRGVSRKPAAKDDGKNPFANMFKKGAPGNNTLNFRGPAGINANKGSNIFDQISSRYQVVQTKKLLLEYEQKE